MEQQLDACLPAALTADQAVQLLLSAMQRLGSAGEAVALYWDQTDCAAPYTLHTEAELRAWLKESLLQFKRGVQQSSTSLNVRAIQCAKAYIHQNYMLDISLEQVSRHVNMSPNYFSSVFAEVAGVHFIDYVAHARPQQHHEKKQPNRHNAKPPHCFRTDIPHVFFRPFLPALTAPCHSRRIL